MDIKSVISQLGGNIEELQKDYAAVSGTLSKLGLSEYESRAYIALVALGSGSAHFVAEIGQIPRTSAYKVMESLEAKGYAQVVQGRPKSFMPVTPSEISGKLISEIEGTFAKLESVKDILSERGIPQLVYTIMGKDRVLDKIGEMLDKSQSNFVISSPSFAEIRKSLGKKFPSAISRGVSVSVITSPFIKAPSAVRVIRRKGLIATDVISDGSTALLAASDLSACGYTDNEVLASHLEEFLRIMSESRD